MWSSSLSLKRKQKKNLNIPDTYYHHLENFSLLTKPLRTLCFSNQLFSGQSSDKVNRPRQSIRFDSLGILSTVWNDFMATNIALDGNFQFSAIVLLLLSHFSHVQLCASLWAIAHQAPLSMEFSRQEYWSGLPCPPPGDGPNPGIKPRSPALEGEFVTTDPPEKPPYPSRPALFDKTSIFVFVVQLLNHVWLFVTPWTAVHQVPLSSTVS